MVVLKSMGDGSDQLCSFVFLHASLPESLVNVMVSYLIRQPRGLSSPALQWAGRGLVQASHCSPRLSGDVHIECDCPLDLNSSPASMWVSAQCNIVVHSSSNHWTLVSAKYIRLATTFVFGVSQSMAYERRETLCLCAMLPEHCMKQISTQILTRAASVLCHIVNPVNLNLIWNWAYSLSYYFERSASFCFHVCSTFTVNPFLQIYK